MFHAKTKKENLVADQIRKLYDQTLFGSVATLVNGCILCFVLRERVDSTVLSAWMAAAVLVSILRISIQRSFRKSKNTRVESVKWKGRFHATLFLAGVLWGSAAFFLYPAGTIGHQVFVAFVTGGMVAGAVGSFTAMLSAFYLFSVPAMVPIIVRFFLAGDELHFVMGAMCLLFFAIMCLTAQRTHLDFVKMLSLGYEKSELVDELRQEVEHRKKAEDDLREKKRQIEKIVEQRTKELKEAVKKLRVEVETRKNMARALEESKQRMHAVIKAAPLVIWAVDKEGVFSFSEGKMLEKIGLNAGQVVGQSLFELFRENKGIIRDAKMALAGELVFSHTTYKGIVFENRYQAIYDGDKGIVGAIGVAFDVTAQIKAQEALRQSEEKYRELVENINDVLFIVDPRFHITYVSPVVETVYGYRPAEMEGKRFIDYVYPHDRRLMETDFENDYGQTAVAGEYRFLSKDGRQKWCRASMRPITEDGMVVGFQGVLADITQSKLLEQKLNRAQKMEALGTLASGVAHDLNNILSGLVSYPDLLLAKMPQDDPWRGPIGIIKKSGERAAAIVQDLLTLSRRGVADLEPVNLNHIVVEYLESAEFKAMMAHFPGIRVEKKLKPDLPNISGSRVHLLKTVMNLLSNAAEAMPDGGTIFVETSRRYEDSSASGFDSLPEGEYAVLTVKDHGIGIEEEDLTRIFEPFYTRKKMGRSGSGLGMAVVWGTVKDHVGHIDVASEKGTGTRFSLYFPSTREPLPQCSENGVGEDLLGHGESILVIDDGEEQRIMATDMLAQLNYRPETVASGEEAVAYLRGKKIDLILLDMIMEPGLDGLETFRRILEINPSQKAVIVSGISEDGKVREAQALGAGRYVKKPYSLKKLAIAIKKELQPNT
jgi:PAS domain S-box-containing protein